MQRTPVEQQYYSLKEKHLDKILMFQLGDFYEMFDEDAIIAAKILNIQLTARNKKQKKTPMCGIPVHSCEQYIHKLVKEGYKVAICRQMELLDEKKKIVAREVVRIVTPSTILNEDYLEKEENNYLASVFFGEKIGLCYSDFSTGEFFIDSFERLQFANLMQSLHIYKPKELLLSAVSGDYLQEEFLKKLQNFQWFEPQKTIQYLPKDFFQLKKNEQTLLDLLKVSFMKATGLVGYSEVVQASGALINYLKEMQNKKEIVFQSLQWMKQNNRMHLDASTMEHLHLFPIPQKPKELNLYDFLNHTITGMGARLLRKWIQFPLTNLSAIYDRQQVIEKFLKDKESIQAIQAILNNIFDIERLATKIFFKQFLVSDLRKIRVSIAELPSLEKILLKTANPLLQKYLKQWENLVDLQKLLINAISDNLNNQKDGDYIKKGYNKELDELKTVAQNHQNLLQNLEQEERKKTKITNLKIRVSKNFGLFIEVSNSYKNLVPDDYIRRQTLTNCERYSVSWLQEIEEKLLSANQEIIILEEQILMQCVEAFCKQTKGVQKMAKIIANIDCLQSLAKVVQLKNYQKPQFFSENSPKKLDIDSARHPLVEESLQDEPFIDNDLFLDQEKDYIQIITGPNMGGKSTYMRQIALLIILAQMGCFVPAEKAKISIFQHIFTRVGASDNILGGESTFMVEMNEISAILRHSNKESFVILDEIGRGTSTYDGISIAWSIVEFLQQKKIITLFATHYHELVQLEQRYQSVLNTFVVTEAKEQEIIFLKKIQKGFSAKSYGIQVASLAGLPSSVVKRALQILKTLEEPVQKSIPDFSQETLFESKQTEKNEEVIAKIKDFSVENNSPLESLKFLSDIKKELKNE